MFSLRRSELTCVCHIMICFCFQVDVTSRIIMVGFADGIMRTLLLHPERLQAQNTMVDVRVHSALTVHSDDSIHADVMDLISVILYMTSQGVSKTI